MELLVQCVARCHAIPTAVFEPSAQANGVGAGWDHLYDEFCEVLDGYVRSHGDGGGDGGDGAAANGTNGGDAAKCAWDPRAGAGIVRVTGV